MPMSGRSWNSLAAYTGLNGERRRSLLVERFIELNGQLYWVNEGLCQEGICPICLLGEIAECGPPGRHDCVEGHDA